MERELEDDRPKPNCFACEQGELQKIETCPAVLALKDKVERFSIRLTECRNENHILKRNLDLAKQMMCKETGEETQDFRALPEIRPEMGWKGRLETILKLSTQVRNLQKEVKQFEEEKPPDVSSDEKTRKNLSAERKTFWRMELERRQARNEAIREINPITEECSELRKKLDTEKTRFQVLKREVNMLRNELQNKKNKNEEEEGLVKSLHEMENQLRATETEISQMRNAYAEAKLIDENLTKEINALRAEMRETQGKTKDNNKRIQTMSLKNMSIQEGLESVKYALKLNAKRYKDDLKQVDGSSKDMAVIYEHIQNLTSEKIKLVRELESLMESILIVARQTDEECRVSFSKSSEPANLSVAQYSPSSEKKIENGTVIDTKQEAHKEEEKQIDSKSLEIDKLMIECAKYRALIEAAASESDRLAYLTTIQENRLNDISGQVVETGRLLTQKNMEKKCLLEKSAIARISPQKNKQTYASNKEANMKLRVNIQAQKEENEFLRALLKKVVESKIQDTYLYKSFLHDSKNFFENALHKVKDVSIVLSSKRN